MTNHDLTLFWLFIAAFLWGVIGQLRGDHYHDKFFDKDAHQRKTFSELIKAEAARDYWHNRYERVLAYRRKNISLPTVVLSEAQKRGEKARMN